MRYVSQSAKINIEPELMVAHRGHGMILGHPFVTGELALGNLSNRAEILFLLERLPKAPTASGSEVTLLVCGFNWSTQHLTSSQREEDVADEEISKKASPYRSRKGDVVESLAAG
jgi:hypothetical protein